MVWLTNQQLGANTLVDVDKEGGLDLNGFDTSVGTLELSENASVLTGGSSPDKTGTLTLSNPDGARLNWNGTPTIVGNVDLGSNCLIEGGDQSLTIDGTISGQGAPTVTAGTVVFKGSHSNTYAGDTSVVAATLILDKSGAGVAAIPANTRLNIGGGTTDNSHVELEQDDQIPSDTYVSIKGETVSSSPLRLGTTLDLNNHDESIGQVFMTGGQIFTGATGKLLLTEGLTATRGLADAARISGAPGAPGSGEVALTPQNHILQVEPGGVPTQPDLVIETKITGPAAAPLIKLGAGTLDLSGEMRNTYAGATYVSDGQLWLDKPRDIAGVGGNLEIDSMAAAVDVNADGNIPVTSRVTVGGLLNLNYKHIPDASGGSYDLGALNVQGGTVNSNNSNIILHDTLTMHNGLIDTVSTAGLVLAKTTRGDDVTATGSDTISGNLDLQTQDRLIDVVGASDTLIISAQIRNEGDPVHLIKLGAGTLKLTGTASNTFTGASDVYDGSLVLDKTGATAINGPVFVVGSNPSLTLANDNQIAPTATITVSGGTVDVGAHSVAIGDLVTVVGDVKIGAGGILTLNGGVTSKGAATASTIEGPGELALGGVASHIFTVENGPKSPDLKISTPIINAAGSNTGLIKRGQGTLELDGQDTYEGVTEIAAGTLVVNGSLSGQVDLAGNAATLAGTGTIAGIAAGTAGGGVVNPGDSISTTAISVRQNVDLGNATYLVGIAGGTNPTTDQIKASGQVNLANGILKLVSVKDGNLGSAPLTIITSAGGIQGEFANAPSTEPYVTLTVNGKPVTFKVAYGTDEVTIQPVS